MTKCMNELNDVPLGGPACLLFIQTLLIIQVVGFFADPRESLLFGGAFSISMLEGWANFYEVFRGFLLHFAESASRPGVIGSVGANPKFSSIGL